MTEKTENKKIALGAGLSSAGALCHLCPYHLSLYAGLLGGTGSFLSETKIGEAGEWIHENQVGLAEKLISPFTDYESHSHHNEDNHYTQKNLETYIEVNPNPEQHYHSHSPAAENIVAGFNTTVMLLGLIIAGKGIYNKYIGKKNCSHKE